ncbi:tetratricopeptide repeat protein [Pannus brasiliensis CCIBt3594]|uniref:Tetratricopeptide repeat protein n=1 Tax=Pannus brasiliensis CCIBt3594 TaxID=1427578 RepID=A0AAW9QT30_9CHRO
MTRLDEGFQRSGRVMITGMGGIGKTELALRYGWREWKKETYHGGICWLNVAESEPGEQILSYARRDLQLTLPDEGTLAERVRYCWQNWVAGDALIIFDDVRDYGQIKDYLPPKEEKRFKVLITTRPDNLSATVEMVPVKELTKTASLALLRSYVSDGRIDGQIEQAKALCLDLGYLPLALELVARLLRRRGEWTLAKIREKLVENGLEDKSLVKNPKFDQEMTAKRGVKAAFDLSWQELENETEAQKLALSLSLFALAPFPKSVIDALFPDEDADNIEEWLTDSLVHLNLVKALGEGWYELHTLIRLYLRDKLEESEIADKAKQAFCNAMVIVAKNIPDSLTLEDFITFNLAIPHLKILVQELHDDLESESLYFAFTGLGNIYKEQGMFTEAEPYVEKCLTLTRQRLENDHPHIATSLNNLGLLYRLQGRYKEAEPLFLESLEIRKRVLGNDHPDVATSLNNLGSLYNFQARYEEAEPLLLEALEIRKRVLDGDAGAFLIAISLDNLGLLYLSQGRYEEAKPLFLQALSIEKRILDNEHPRVATSLNNLGLSYSYQKQYEEAEPLFLEAISIGKQSLGDYHLGVAVFLDNLGSLYYSKGRDEEAQSLFVEALDIRKRLLSDNHPHVVNSMKNLAGLYRSQGHYQDSESLYLEALSHEIDCLDDRHPSIAISLNNLARLYDTQGRYEEAELLYIEAIAIARERLGENHPTTQALYRNNDIMLLRLPDRELQRRFPPAIVEYLRGLREKMLSETIA